MTPSPGLPVQFSHEPIDTDPPNDNQMVCLSTDLTGNGRDDVVIGARDPPTSVYWYENPGWEQHKLADVPSVESGGAFADITGNGQLDVLVGGHWGSREAYWVEQPADPRDEWAVRVVCQDYHKYHDQGFADVDDDGEPEVILLSQNSEVVCYYDLPEEPTEEPWPRENRTIVAAGVGDTEGIQVLDIDDDGRTELVVGRRIFHREDQAGEEWTAERVAPGWQEERVRVVASDIDEDGTTELLLTECELPALGERHGIDHDGRFAVCRPPDWEAEVVRDDLYCPHSLQVADFDGDGHDDVFLAESDFGGHETPRHFVLENRGDGTFETHVVHEGTGIHEAKVADLTGTGTVDIVGKNDTDDAHVDAYYNET
jgi:hypothetical protein